MCRDPAQEFRPDLHTLVGLSYGNYKFWQFWQCLADLSGRGQHLVCPGTHPDVLGEVDPAHGASGIHQEFRGPGDVSPARAAFGVYQIVAAQDLLAWI